MSRTGLAASRFVTESLVPSAEAILVAIVVLLAGSSCRRTADRQERTTVSLRDFRVTLELPPSWSMLQDQSDPKEGLVAFSGTCGTGYSGTAFLDATSQPVPQSTEEAEREALKADDCRAQGSCLTLSRETLSNGGHLVAIQTPKTVRVESWRRLDPQKTVRCGAELFFEASTNAGPKRMEVCRAMIEGICRSVSN